MAAGPWGGSEELWTQTAIFLAKQGLPVAASIQGWPKLHERLIEVRKAGVDLRQRPFKRSLAARVRRRISRRPQIVFDIEHTLGNISPSLVVISNGFVVPPIELAEMCVAKGWPFVTIAHVNVPTWWPSDELTVRFRKTLSQARRCFFVSNANRVLAERQLGYAIDNAEIICNPLTVEVAQPIPWPNAFKELRMACVGRLSPEKGQDILLDALATPAWRDRDWRLTFYGEGPGLDMSRRLVNSLSLQSKVFFAGHIAVEKIWPENHVLVMPSRHEGMPLAIVEAMWCGRPVVATDVGGISELVKEGSTGFLAEAATAQCFGKALERMWVQRDKLEEIGKVAAASIRKYLPAEPVEIFAAKIKDLAEK
jgi:glycosyltransferase involved in cell wall biosynthesis